jgi:CBS domain-containing protein
MIVEDLMTKNPTCCTPDTNLFEVAKMMVECGCGAIPVVDGFATMRPMGIVTDRDITCRAIASGRNPLQMEAKDCMSGSTVVVQKNTSLGHCCRIMENNKIRRVLVVDELGKVCGIVSQADIALKAPAQAKADIVEKISKPKL